MHIITMAQEIIGIISPAVRRTVRGNGEVVHPAAAICLPHAIGGGEIIKSDTVKATTR